MMSSSHNAEGFETTEKNVFLTGLPGSGKSTVMIRCIEKLRRRGLAVGGIATPEVRVRGRRVGFDVVDVASGFKALMAGVEVSSSFRVGKYGVDVVAFESIALPALEHAERISDLVAIDEIGRMELLSEQFKKRVDELLMREKPVLAVLHRNYVKSYGSEGILYEVTQENRDSLVDMVTSHIVGLLE